SGGRFGGAFEFDGVDDYVDAGNAASLNTPKAITVEAWVKTTQIPSTGNRAKIVYKQHEPEWRYYMITLENNGMANFRLYDGTNNPGVTSSSVINDGSWHHIVAVRLSGTLSIYNNGVSNHASDTTTAEYSTSNNLLIGKGDWSEVSYPFNGTIDEVRIYNRALTAMEIQKHYAESAPRHGIVLK
ncbi:LamG domain-containing protein, partial [Patescibacteria group bacterium]|nr:LamG domain-containing protein [Patescibacteria group bacterium]